MEKPRYMQERVPNHLRRAKYRTARALGCDDSLSRRIREWSMNKFIVFLYYNRVRKNG